MGRTFSCEQEQTEQKQSEPRLCFLRRDLSRVSGKSMKHIS